MEKKFSPHFSLLKVRVPPLPPFFNENQSGVHFLKDTRFFPVPGELPKKWLFLEASEA